MKRIVFKNPDGSCGVVVPAPKHLATLMKDNTEDEALGIIAEKAVPDGLGHRICTTADLPQDRDFRDAWTDDNDTDTVDVDMPKARVMHMDNIRSKRDEKLKELDIETLRGNDVQVQKQVLRDIPGNFDLTTATTPEELKALWPTELE